ncbi:MAG TPA: VWA domain-containing protein [Vicinamibacteria bacterium]
MVFESPSWLLGLLALPVLALLEGWLRRRDRERVARLVARPLWARVVRRPGERWAPLRRALLYLGAAGVLVALARPQWGIVREKIEREGVDIVVALDTSGSMATEDVAPNRFFLARQALGSLVARLEGDRFGLVAFEGEAYPLVPLTLDADALGLFLETMEPGIVPSPGSSLGQGLARGLGLFVDTERRNKVMVLVSDGEDLEGDVEAAVQRAKEAGVVVHTVGVGTEAGQPVPDFDKDGRRTGFKRDQSGQVVVSRLDMGALEAIARGTGGQAFRLSPADTSLAALASVIEGMEHKTLAREYAYRRKERFQIPLGVGLLALTAGLVLPPPRRLRARAAAPRAAAALLAGLLGLSARADPPAPAPSPSPSPAARGGALGEVLLRPRRLTESGRREYERGNHPEALRAFEGAAGARPGDPRARFNLADGLYKTGRYDEAAGLFRALGDDAGAGLGAAARFNLGNTLYQKQDYRGAVQAYRDALRAAPGDGDARRNLELAWRALREQQEQQQRDQKRQQEQKDPQQDQQQDQKQGQSGEPKKKDPKQQGQPSPSPSPSAAPQTPEQRADQRFRQETGMPKERAMQLLDALQQNEKAEQKKRLEALRAVKKGTKDW